MNINFNTTITLSPEDVKGIIAEYLEGKGYKTSDRAITIHVESYCEGYGMSEHQALRLKDITVKVEKE